MARVSSPGSRIRKLCGVNCGALIRFAYATQYGIRAHDLDNQKEIVPGEQLRV